MSPQLTSWRLGLENVLSVTAINSNILSLVAPIPDHTSILAILAMIPPGSAAEAPIPLLI